MKEYDYLFIQVDIEDKELENTYAKKENRIDVASWENLFHKLKKEQLEMIICIGLGLKRLEIIDLLDLKNNSAYSAAREKLKRRSKKFRYYV